MAVSQREPWIFLPPRPRIRVLLGVGVLGVMVALMLIGPTRAVIEEIDLEWWEAMVEAENSTLVWLAKVMAIVGSVWITTPLRIGLSLWYIWHRSWAHLILWVSAIFFAEATLSIMKALFGRERPDLGLTMPQSSSFPSGHTTATTATVVALVMLFAHSDAQRRRWAVGGTTFVAVMAISRTYIRVHWLSDVIVGLILGITAALAAAWVTREWFDRRARISALHDAD